MFTKRKYSSRLAGDEEQENAAADAGPNTNQQEIAAADAGPNTKQQCQPKSPLVESQRKKPRSEFEKAWLNLQYSTSISSSPTTTDWATRFATCRELANTSWPALPRRTKSMPFCRSHISPRSASAQTGGRAPRKTSELWNEFKDESLNDSSHTGVSDDSYIGSSPEQIITKRKYSSRPAGDVQQENAAADAGPNTKQQCQPKSPLVESQRKKPRSEFEKAWLNLQNSTSISSSPTTTDWATRFATFRELANTSWPALPRRTKSMPFCRSHISPRSASAQTGGRAPRKTSQLWNELKDQSMNGYIDSSLGVQLVPEPTVRQYLPAFSRKKAVPERCVKGGYVDEFRTMMKETSMDHRHLSDRKSTHTVHLLDISKDFGVYMARVEPVPETNSGDSTFNILLPSEIGDKVSVGSTVKFYLGSKTNKPLQLRNKQRMYFQPLNILKLKKEMHTVDNL
ncbi:uncharacterized protein LOC108161756 isoform X2 [Drosophila miranda]|uniref:uncharacterized protein LOC108161756 isoform X2 n=1 Tax=Drosophila miranda TaxID=7229 RepID=UPI00143F4A60|nr:uncharacterized protein LOC108161756 isoform X2 [Drosophila miranda]